MSKATGEGPQIFISYDKTYQEQALALHGRLRKDLRGKFGRDIDVFIDQENLATGAEWDAQIRAALQTARLMIVLVSDGIVTRPYCRIEINTLRSKIAAGEQCFVLAVKWQHDSEIYRSSSTTQVQTDRLDQAYLASLSDDERNVVLALRKLQYLEGAALRESSPASDPYNNAFLELSTEVARLYRELRVSGRPDPREAAEGLSPVGDGAAETTGERLGLFGAAIGNIGPVAAAAEPRRPRGRMPLIAAGIAVLVIVSALAIPSIRQAILEPGHEITGPAPGPIVLPEPPTTEPPVQPPSTPNWQSVDWLVENRSGRDAVAHREAKPDSPALETLSPGVIRPLVGVKGPVETADISGVVWLSYPTQVEGVRGFIRATDLEP